MRRSQKILTLLRIPFESANQKNKFLAVTRATRDVILKKTASEETTHWQGLPTFTIRLPITPQRTQFFFLGGGGQHCSSLMQFVVFISWIF